MKGNGCILIRLSVCLAFLELAMVVVSDQETLSRFELIYLFYFAFCMLIESPFPTNACD